MAKANYEIRRVETVADIIAEIGLASQRLDGRVWFRGQSDSAWGLLPKVYRPFASSEDSESLVYDRLDEVGICAQFMTQAPSRQGFCPEPEAFEEWLCLMQHHGLPTRLLDWSASPLVAAFFAVAEEQYRNTPGALWVLAPTRLNDIRPRTPGGIIPTMHKSNREVRNLVKAAFNSQQNNAVAVISVFPPHVDPRMMLQQSTFTIHSRFSVKGTGIDLTRLKASRPMLIKLEIPAKKKPLLLSELSRLGIRRSALFPDLRYLAEDIARESKCVSQERNQRQKAR